MITAGAVLIGEISERLNDPNRVKLAYDEALKINPGLLRARVGLANWSLAAGDKATAKAQAFEALGIILWVRIL